MKTAVAILLVLAVLVLGSIAYILIKAPQSAPVQTQTPTQETPVQQPPAATATPASKDDLIVLDSPLPGATVSSPLTVTGKARGSWYFEASFPIVLVDWDGRIIGEGHAEAQGDWMTQDYVPFKGTITFISPDTSVSNRGAIILRKDNPSGDPKNDNALEVEIKYQ